MKRLILNQVVIQKRAGNDLNLVILNMTPGIFLLDFNTYNFQVINFFNLQYRVL